MMFPDRRRLTFRLSGLRPSAGPTHCDLNREELMRLTHALSLCARVSLVSLALFSPSGMVAQQQQSQPFSGGGHLTYTVTQSGGSCGMYGQGSYQSANYSNLVYVDLNGNQNALGGGGSYITSTGGNGCPPNGPEPTNGITYTRSEEH